MVFGELVIPSSRALWDDEYGELVEYEGNDIEWEQGYDPVENINSLYVIDTPTVLKLFEACVLTGSTPINRSKNAGLKLYKLGDDVIVSYENNPQFTSGEIVQNVLSDLIGKSKRIYGITSCPIALYQGDDVAEDATCFIKTLCPNSKDVKGDFQTLQIPNLVTGITANVFSYCVHIRRDCRLFIGYVDAAPLDSINTEAYLKLFKEIGLEVKAYYNLILQAPSNNLYM